MQTFLHINDIKLMLKTSIFNDFELNSSKLSIQKHCKTLGKCKKLKFERHLNAAGEKNGGKLKILSFQLDEDVNCNMNLVKVVPRVPPLRKLTHTYIPVS